MILLIKAIVAIWVVVKILDITIATYIQRSIKRRKAEFEHHNQKLWLKRYQKTIPAWFAMTNKMVGDCVVQ